MRYWTLTSLGKKLSGDISKAKNETHKILSYLHETKSASSEDIAMHFGVSEARINAMLRKLARRGLVRELTGNV